MEKKEKLFICVRCGHTGKEMVSVCQSCGGVDTTIDFEESLKYDTVAVRFSCKSCGKTIVVAMGEVQEIILLCCNSCFEIHRYDINEDLSV